MVPYYGHHSSKMFIRGKPIRLGQKIWAITSTSGYPFKKNMSQHGTRVIKRMTLVLADSRKHQVYFNNFFASKDLLTTLRTLRNTRTKGIPLMETNKVAKKQRGFFDYKCDGNVYVCRWNDSSVVTLASNHSTHLPVGQTKRYSKKQRKRIDVAIPNIVENHNESIGGVDTMDVLLSMVIAWRLHCELHDADRSAMTHLAFRRGITAHLLRARPLQISRPGPCSHLPHSLRSSRGHFLQSSTQG
ncbi:PiggyBac transposable element-derived protein 3 [Trichinella zimbabwensis]|uniref:PiggyBac transposable element-derived protein 3 n=1 Tax=Trichinella zimbabwensis TaxID=268475 RepID=A0A0V1I199_9BILA|nr:PiggyBac transposable element-derived protein 3 [Trichinella zimbabwensis]